MFSLHIPTDTQIMTMCGDEYVNGLDCGNHFTMYMYIKTTNCTPFSSVQLLNCAQFFRIPWSEARQASLTITNSQSLLKLMSNELVMPSNDLILCRPLFLLPSIFPSIRESVQWASSNQSVQWVSSSHQVAKVLKLQHQSLQWVFRTDFLQDWLVWSPWSPKSSQESSPTPQFKSISSLMLRFLYGPALTSIHDYWKNNSFD